MGIEAKHEYRFGYLKSEEWHDLRIRRLAHDHGRCRFCLKLDWSNDVHHMLYRPDRRDTKISDLRTMCRSCHDLMHEIMEKYPAFKDIKTSAQRRWKMLRRKMFEFLRDTNNLPERFAV